MINWSELNKYKDELMPVANFWDLSISTKSSQEIALEYIKDGDEVLDIGASQGKFKEFVLSKKSCTVKTMDVDKKTRQDFYHIKEVRGFYDVITMFATIEHITLNDLINLYIPKITSSLKPNGILIISTNNIFHNLGIRSDVTHVQSYSPRDLYSILRSSGFVSGKGYRITKLNAFLRAFYTIICKYILRPLYIDFVPEICLILKYSGKEV